ncbi:hypothetical protein BGX28_003569 [Mortierella sp. GBA30]|nr:hypothetical protein BGX28_003569 [Mortierella sp. GBA30]
MRLSTSASLLATAIIFSAGSAHAQGVPATNPPPPPTLDDNANVVYFTNGNNAIGTEYAPFNTCYISATAFNDYAYVTFAPQNATINFYKDTQCQDFAFGLVGYYIGNPGAARSFRWVGWSEDTIGQLFDKEPIQGQGDAAHGPPRPRPPSTVPPGTPGNPNNVPPVTPVSPNKDQNNSDEDSNGSSVSSTFFGGVFGTLVVLSIGGIIYWKKIGRNMVEDKGKGVLPYNRVDDSEANGDNDILLTSKDRSDNFELGDEDDEDDDEGDKDDKLIQTSARKDRYHDEDDHT